MDGISLRDLVDGHSDPTAAWGPVPLLIVKAPGADADAPTVFHTPPDGLLTDTETMRIEDDPGTTGYVAPGAVVVPLRKTKRNPFAEMITVGRANSNDVILDDTRVSKLHCWFIPPRTNRDPWMIRDHKATNGTYINRMQLAAEMMRPVVASDEIRFGMVEAIFIEAGMLQALVDYARATWTRLGIIKRKPRADDTVTMERPPEEQSTPVPPPSEAGETKIIGE